MTSKTRTIEVDEATAEALQSRAEERGVSVSALLTELVSLDAAPLAIDSDEIVELDRRWAAVEGGEPTVPHDQVVRWLETWGTPAYKPWQNG
jgi:predicted transcriptional regulator